MDDLIAKFLPDAVAIRHKLHEYPELKYEEYETSKLVAQKLQEYGYEVKTGLAKTGVTAVLDCNRPGRTVALRADMDALPIHEKTNLPYASKRPGYMHACGHDGHTATLLLIARVLKTYAEHHPFNGKIKFIFQPAEEGGNGAKAMIRDGVLESPKVDAIFGYHNFPTFPMKKVLYRSGCILAGASMFKVTLKGIGGHSSSPHLSVDPLYVGSAIVQALQSIVSRNCFPMDPSVVSVCSFKSGDYYNIIPDEAELLGSIRFTNQDNAEFIKRRIDEIIANMVAAFGAEYQLEFVEETPATINTELETNIISDTAKSLFGEENTLLLPHNQMPMEDFSFYLEKIPGAYVLIGNGEDTPFCHNPKFQFHDEIMPVAAKLLGSTALEYLTRW